MDLKEITSQFNQQLTSLSTGENQLRQLTTELLLGRVHGLKPSVAWHGGTNIGEAVRLYPALSRGWIMAQVGQLCKDVDAKKTLSTDEELKFTCRAILSEHPTLKMEELVVCFDMIRMGKFGKLYERLKSAEILECLRQYEGEIRAQILEDANHQGHHDHTQRMIDNIDPALIAQFINDERVKMKGEGIGTRLKKKLDAYAEYDPSLLDPSNKK